MTTTSPPPASETRLGFGAQMNRFWQRVTEGMKMAQLWAQFRAEARSSFNLYQRDFRAQASAEKSQAGWLQKTQEFAWALLEKLTPARRVLLLIGLMLLIFPVFSTNVHGKADEVHAPYFDFHFYGGLLLFLLLLLEVADRVVMKRDLEIAHDIQSWLLPAQAPQIPGLQIAFGTRPANTVAGDYYDVFPRPALGPGHFFVVVADVAGKSIPAALLMATLQASLRTLSATSSSLADLASGLNRYVCTNSQGGLRFTTAFLAEFDAYARTLTYINAGHNNPVLRRASGGIERLIDGGLPLGIQDDVVYDSGRVDLQPGDWLLVFTDGLVEATNQVNEEFGEARMLQVMNDGVTFAPDQLLRSMMSNLDAFVGATPQHDDVTCLLIKAA